MRGWFVHWKAIAGALLTVAGCWNGFKWLLDWAGRIDVFRSWGNTMMESAPSVPSWASLVLLVLGLGLIWWDLKRGPLPGFQIGGQVQTVLFGARITLLEFVDVAEQQGWKISGTHDLEGVDLLDGLRQAGSDGQIQFWGRLDRYGNGTFVSSEVLAPITSEHWRKFQFDWGSVVPSHIRGARDNTQTRTYNFFETNNRQAGGYVDIHLDGKAAGEQLPSFVVTYKGKRQLEENRRR